MRKTLRFAAGIMIFTLYICISIILLAPRLLVKLSRSTIKQQQRTYRHNFWKEVEFDSKDV